MDEHNETDEATLNSTVAARVWVQHGVGDKIGGKYEIIKRLGAGGFGEVWLAHDTLLEQQVAIKLIRPQFAEDERAHANFLKEARTMIKLKHAHIVSIYYLGHDKAEALIYLVMEWAELGTLADKLKAGPLAIPDCERIFSQICQAVEYAHQQKVIHLDLKPHNILLNGQDNVLVADFGLARVLEKTSVALSQKLGTPLYMAPEQTWSDSAGGFSDVYALGLILHEMLTGQRPAREVQERKFIIRCAESVPGEFKSVIEQATQDDRKKRFPTVKALVEGFQTAIKTRDLFNNGNVYLNKGEYDQAIANYDEVIRLNSKFAMAYYNRGNAYNAKKNYDQAIADYSKAIRLKPNLDTTPLALAYGLRGNGFYNQEKYDQAIRDYTEAIDLNPHYVNIYYNRGIAYHQKNDYDHAIEDFTEVIRLNPIDADAYNNRGIVYKNKGDYDQAIADYSEAILLKPTEATYNNRGNAYYAKGAYNFAMYDYGKAISLEPKGVFSHISRGFSYTYKGSTDRVIADYLNPIRLEIDVHDTKVNYESAIIGYTKAIELNPNQTDTYYKRGLVYKDMGQRDKAIADFRKAVELDNNYIEALTQLRELGVEV